jgi:hypothetical protein
MIHAGGTSVFHLVDQLGRIGTSLQDSQSFVFIYRAIFLSYFDNDTKMPLRNTETDRRHGLIVIVLSNPWISHILLSLKHRVLRCDKIVWLL